MGGFDALLESGVPADDRMMCGKSFGLMHRSSHASDCLLNFTTQSDGTARLPVFDADIKAPTCVSSEHRGPLSTPPHRNTLCRQFRLANRHAT